jgi:hypothetical protein
MHNPPTLARAPAQLLAHVLAWVVAALLVASCSKPSGAPGVTPPPPPQQPETARSRPADDGADRFFDPKENPGAVIGVPVDPHTLTSSQLQYGIAPKRDPRVTYAPDVIVMEEGDKAIRMAASDGMTWVFDAAAPHVNEFQEGRIIFATGRAVGRIGTISRSNGAVTVKLAPVQITDVIQDGHFLINSSFSVNDLIIYSAPDFPSILDLSAPQTKAAMDWDAGDGAPHLIRTALIPVQASIPVAPGGGSPVPAPAATIANPAPISLGDNDFKVYPLCGSDASIGLEYDFNARGVYVKSSGSLHLGGTGIRFVLDITHGSIQKFGMQLTGVAGMGFKFESYAAKDTFVNAHKIGELPIDMTLPIPVAGVPLELTVHTKFELNTGYSAKTSTLSATGDYSITGQLFIGWQRNGPGIDPKLTPKAETDLGRTLDGVSVGINSMALGFMVEPMVGIGAFGFNTGVYVGVDFGGSVVKQSSVALVDCRAGYINAKVYSGVGYQLSGPFVKFVNTVLSAFTRYRLDQSGTLIKGPEADIMHGDTQIPKNCATPR